jgi:hypothetical protein
MALALTAIRQLLPVLQSIPQKSDTRILVLGAQDLAFTYEQAVAFLGAEGVPIKPVPPELRMTTASFAIFNDSLWQRYRHFMHQQTFFQLMGFGPGQIDTLDVSDFENANIIHDLNQPPTSSFGQYDLIINAGTLEHVFDVRQALWTLSDLTKVNGQIVHIAPAGLLNHGFYNFNAGFFSDFYEQSGWAREELYYCLAPRVADVDELMVFLKMDVGKLNHMPNDHDLGVFARYRKTEATQSVFAVQQYYRDLHAAWAGRRRQEDRDGARPAQAEADRKWLSDAMRQRATEKAIQQLSAYPGELVVVSPTHETAAVETCDVDLDMSRAVPETSFSWRLDLPDLPVGDAPGMERSSQLLLLENGAMLGPAHAIHDDIRSLGAGRYSHWGKSLYFSTADNSAPVTNGRHYSARFPVTFLSSQP